MYLNSTRRICLRTHRYEIRICNPSQYIVNTIHMNMKDPSIPPSFKNLAVLKSLEYTTIAIWRNNDFLKKKNLAYIGG